MEIDVTSRSTASPAQACRLTRVRSPLRLALVAGLVVAAVGGGPLHAAGQGGDEGASRPRQVSATDYARAEALIGWNARELVINDAVSPRWMTAHTFWYRN